MTYYAQITNGVVTAVTQTAGPIDSPDMIEIDGLLDIAGHSYDAATGEFTAPPPEPVNPTRVTMRQARLALLAAGKLAGVNAAINTLPSPQKEAAQIEWEYSNEVLRHNGFVAQLGPTLGMTDADLDALFVLAAGL